jgi:ureidoglycolate hydrolase
MALLLNLPELIVTKPVKIMLRIFFLHPHPFGLQTSLPISSEDAVPGSISYFICDVSFLA